MTSPSSPPTDPAAEPVCPRHPERVSYVRCQRCARPTCPQCQRQAPVGVQCVDCVRAQAKTVRGGRTRYGGAMSHGRPVVTYSIIGACGLMLLAQLATGDALTLRLDFVPFLAEQEPWRFLSAGFLHSTRFLPHLLFNMVALYQVGPLLEERLGRLRYLTAYLLCAIGGSVGYLLLAQPSEPSWGTSVVGASGAVFGMFALLVIDQRRGGETSQGILVIVGLNFALGLVIPDIAWQSHLGGLLTGAGLGAALMFAPAARRALVQGLGTAAVALVLVLVTVAKLATVG